MNIENNESINMKKIDKVIEDDIICPICYESCKDINIECDKCPYRFCFDCLKKCFKTAKKQVCPMCRGINQIDFYV